MSTEYQGASIEPRAMLYWSLFDVQLAIKGEIERRAWDYLKEVGYDWYKGTSMRVTMIERGKVKIILIDAEYEHNHSSHEVQIEVPYKQFEALVPPPATPKASAANAVVDPR